MKIIFKLLFTIIPWVLMLAFRKSKAIDGKKPPLSANKNSTVIDGEIVK